MKQHLAAKHNIGRVQIKCPKCSKPFSRESNMLRHMGRPVCVPNIDDEEDEVDEDEDEVEDEVFEVFEVEAISDSRQADDGGNQYRIKWKNYPESASTWEDERNLDCPEILERFHRNRTNSLRGKSRHGSPNSTVTSASADAPAQTAVDATIVSICNVFSF